MATRVALVQCVKKNAPRQRPLATFTCRSSSVASGIMLKHKPMLGTYCLRSMTSFTLSKLLNLTIAR